MTRIFSVQGSTSAVHDLEIMLSVRDATFLPFEATLTPADETFTNARSPSYFFTQTRSVTQPGQAGADEETLEQIEKNRPLIELLQSWLLEDSLTPDPELEDQMRELDKDRLSTRPLFPWLNH